MKKVIILFVCFGLFSSLGLASTEINPSIDPLADGEIIFHNKHVKLDCLPDAKLQFIAMVSYNETNEYFSLKTFKEVAMIQILNNEGVLDFQLPIQGNLVHLGLSNFDDGNYILNVLFEGEEQYLQMDLEIK